MISECAGRGCASLVDTRVEPRLHAYPRAAPAQRFAASCSASEFHSGFVVWHEVLGGGGTKFGAGLGACETALGAQPEVDAFGGGPPVHRRVEISESRLAVRGRRLSTTYGGQSSTCETALPYAASCASSSMI